MYCCVSWYRDTLMLAVRNKNKREMNDFVISIFIIRDIFKNHFLPIMSIEKNLTMGYFVKIVLKMKPCRKVEIGKIDFSIDNRHDTDRICKQQ